MLENKRIADEYAARKKLRAQAAPLETPRADWQPYSYKVGDRWTVAVLLLGAPTPPVNSQTPRGASAASSNVALYHFTVRFVAGEVFHAEVEREGVAGSGLIVADRRGHVRAVPIELPSVGIDLFPANVPQFDSGTVKPGRALPEAPPELRPLSAKFEPTAESSSVQFTAEDAMGRAVEVLWKKQTPWPAYMRGPAGISYLLREAR